MKEMLGNLFDIPCDAFCITTNGFVKGNGEAVMGKGCAAQAADLMPKLPALLGKHIKANGNHVHVLGRKDGKAVCSFPVKPVHRPMMQPTDVVSHMRNKFKIGHDVPGWACTASIHIIEQSAKQLKAIADLWGWETVVLPRAGCGAGELKWSQVRPILEQYLDDRFIAVTY